MRIFLVIVWLVCCLGMAVRPTLGLSQQTFSGQTMGSTTWNASIVDPPAGVDPEKLESAIVERLEEVNRRMSTYRDDSEISRFNASTSTDWFEVSEATAALVERSIEFHRATEGAFDITVSPLVELWNFGREREGSAALPSEAEIAAARAHVGSVKLAARTAPAPAIRKTDPLLQIDLSSIAEGYAVDQVAEVLEQFGCRNFLFELGGEVIARGVKADGASWQVAIVRPVAGELAFDHVVAARDIAVSTSGNYRNFYEVDGRRYSHFIDPTTGHPVENDVASATVLAKDCATADVLSTAAMVLGVERGHAVCQRLSAPLLTLERTAKGFDSRTSGDIPMVARPAEAAAPWRTVAAAFLVFGMAVAAMAVGVMFGRRRIQGSCGGIANSRDAEGNIACGLCRNPAAECRERLGQRDPASTSSGSSP